MRRLILLLLPVVALACGGESALEPTTCPVDCGKNASCERGECVCDDGYVDCDGNPANGCEPAATCGCAYEGDASFCGRNEASCGDLAAEDNCGNRRVVNCGSCSDGQTCGAQETNRCGEGSCTPETETELCRDLGWMCGPGDASNRCGESMIADCGTCPSGWLCNPRHECVDAGLELRELCAYGGSPVGECAPHLECVGSEEYAVCLQVCTADEQCPAGESCAFGWLDAGTGICGDLRLMGQSCSWPDEGADFCWDVHHWDEFEFACLRDQCQIVCDYDTQGDGTGDRPGGGHDACPDGSACSGNFIYAEELDLQVKLCVPYE